MREPGAVVRDRRCASGSGTEVWDKRFSLLLERKKVEPAAAERACRDIAADTEDRAALNKVGSEGWKLSRFSIARIPDISQRDEEVISS